MLTNKESKPQHHKRQTRTEATDLSVRLKEQEERYDELAAVLVVGCIVGLSSVGAAPACCYRLRF